MNSKADTKTMNQEKKYELKPKLRFPKFRDAAEWEEKKLSAIAELTSSKRVHLSDYVPNGIPFFRGKEISLLKNNQIPEDILYISEEHYEEIRETYGVPEIGDILITAVGTLGNVYCIKESNKFYFKDGNLIWMKNISEDSTFLEISLNVRNKDILLSAIGSSQKALTMIELNKLRFVFPKIEEQKKITNCLSSIDDRITAETQKLGTLKVHKKGLMQQLFPAEGETVPDRRFPEFQDTGEWEKKKLGEAAIFHNGKAYKQEELLESGKYKVLRVGNFFTNKNWYYSDLELDETKYCDDGDLLYAWSASFGPRIWQGQKVIYHYHIWRVLEKRNIDKKFLFITLEYETERLKSQSANGLGLLHITKGTIEGWGCSFPTIAEQKKIGDCLSSIDELITAQTQKIDTLKTHKKGLMQQLFPAVEEAIE
jgi:type I restriction enzyme S subunit